MATIIGLGIDDIIAPYREEILRIAAEHNATNVRVFGSVARGEAQPNSDIDLLVDFKPGYTLWDHIGLKQALEALFDRHVDVVAEADLKAGFRPYIMQDAMPL